MTTTDTTASAAQHRADAARYDARAAASFDRCDTDGALSQWADGMSAQLHRAQAEIDDAGGVATFPALFDLDGNLVAARLIDTRYGTRWGVLSTDDPRSQVTAWLSAFPVRPSTLTRRGYRQGTVRTRARARLWAPPGARGISGATQVSVIVERCDGGFSRDVEIVDTGA